MSFSFNSQKLFQPNATSFQFSNASTSRFIDPRIVQPTPIFKQNPVINQINPGIFQIDPSIILQPPLQVQPVFQPTPTPPVNTLPTNVPSQLLALLAAIPIATDGRVITSEYHNTLRAAVLALAGQLGVGLITPTIVLTIVPNFLPDGDSTNWRITNGAAVKPLRSSALGWLPLALPDGARLQSLSVFGTRSVTPTKFEVRIVRQPVALDASSNSAPLTPLMAVDLKNANSPFNASTNKFLVNGLGTTATAAATEDYKTIDSSTYKYLLFAEISDDANSDAQINAIQINYAPGLAG